jgi:uncharacterized protein (TIGR02246 family)
MRHLLALAGLAVLTTGCYHKPTKMDVEAQGTAWAEALSSRDPETITDLYDDDAVLLATFTTKAQGEDAILEYFEGLTKNEGLSVRFDDQIIEVVGRKAAINTGTYTFSYKDKDGKTVEVPARYTFVYEKEGKEWEIISHHSSIRPENK